MGCIHITILALIKCDTKCNFNMSHVTKSSVFDNARNSKCVN